MPNLGMHLEVKLVGYSYIIANVAGRGLEDIERGTRVMKSAKADFI
jgi:hypothetical protein